MKVVIITLGCKANQFESQAMEKLFAESGCEIVQDGEADIYIVNSCTVTAVADKKTRGMIRHLRREHPSAVIGVCGCMAQLAETADIAALGADVVGGNRDHRGFAAEVLRAAGLRCTASAGCEGFELLPAGGLVGRTRALLKIEDGCRNYCSYCVIPFARGEVRSMPYSELISEAARLSGEGYREIVLTGIEISAYRDGDKGILEAVEGVCRAASGSRVALGSLKPTVVTDEFCRRLSKFDNLCRHFHLSLQSCCDATLSRMNRHYTQSDIFAAADRLRGSFDNVNLTADIICGFPGETEGDFLETAGALERLSLGGMHIFPYSVRLGTSAAAMPDKICRAERERRCRVLSELNARCRSAFLAAQIGLTHRVLVESGAGGYTDNYLYCELSAQSGAAAGEFVRAHINGAVGENLLGTVE